MKSAQELNQMMNEQQQTAVAPQPTIEFTIDELNQVLFHINNAAEALIMLSMSGDETVKSVVNMKTTGLQQAIELIQNKATNQ